METYVTIIDYTFGESVCTDLEYAGQSKNAALIAAKAANDKWITHDPELILTVQIWSNGEHIRNLNKSEIGI